ncbi:hypothetical protein J6U76_08265 [bacterium]|nr:hypothetical protein [bacterium]
MKKIFLIISIITINAFCIDSQEEIMGWLINVSQKPHVWDMSKQASFELWTTNLSNYAELANLRFGNVNLNQNGLTNINVDINRNENLACEADFNIKSVPPSFLLPLLFQILETGAFGTNEFYEYYDNWIDERDGEAIGICSKGKVFKKQAKIYAVTKRYIRESLKLLTKSEDWYITEIWAKHHWPPPSPSNFYIYWWYEGRKYATNIWNDFYTCWQYEQARQNPREGVLDCLAKEISELGISAIPLVKGAIDSGDNTLNPVLKALAIKLEDGGLTNQTFASWYSSNGSKYTLPACEGLEAAKLRITDTNYVNELNGIFSIGSLGHKTIRTDKSYKEYMQAYSREMLSYYTNRPAVPDYWYYKLPDEISNFTSRMAFELDRNCTNFNPRYLTPAD